MKTKRLVQHTLAFLCFTIASCSKNKPCVGSKTREESPKQASIKVLTANIPTPPASSTNLITTTSSQGLTAEVTKLSDNLSSSISTPNTSSSALYSSTTKSEPAIIKKSLTEVHSADSDDPVAELHHVLSEGIRPKVADKQSIEEAYEEFYVLVYKVKEELGKDLQELDLVNKAYTYKKLPTVIADHYYRAALLQLVILLSNVEKTYEMKQIGGKEDTRTVQKFLAGGFLAVGNFIAKRTVDRWRELGITLDGKTIDYWKKSDHVSSLESLRKK